MAPQTNVISQERPTQPRDSKGHFLSPYAFNMKEVNEVQTVEETEADRRELLKQIHGADSQFVTDALGHLGYNEFTGEHDADHYYRDADDEVDVKAAVIAFAIMIILCLAICIGIGWGLFALGEHFYHLVHKIGTNRISVD